MHLRRFTRTDRTLKAPISPSTLRTVSPKASSNDQCFFASFIMHLRRFTRTDPTLNASVSPSTLRTVSPKASSNDRCLLRASLSFTSVYKVRPHFKRISFTLNPQGCEPQGFFERSLLLASFIMHLRRITKTRFTLNPPKINLRHSIALLTFHSITQARDQVSRRTSRQARKQAKKSQTIKQASKQAMQAIQVIKHPTQADKQRHDDNNTEKETSKQTTAASKPQNEQTKRNISLTPCKRALRSTLMEGVQMGGWELSQMRIKSNSQRIILAQKLLLEP